MMMMVVVVVVVLVMVVVMVNDGEQWGVMMPMVNGDDDGHGP